MSDQLAFASFSGDFNPIHLDSVASRRTVAGRCIVHGMHSLLWALDELARISITATKLHARFLKPIFLNEDVCCTWDGVGKLHVTVDDVKVVDITLTVGLVPAIDSILSVPLPGRSMPAIPKLADCIEIAVQPFQLHGAVDLAIDLFPAASRAYSLYAIAETAALSYIVGMEVPGMHSLFSGLRLDFTLPQSNSIYFLSDFDERFNLLTLAVEGYSLQAEIEAFYRPPPILMPTMKDICLRASSQDQTGVCALIVGGSRGLGEITAKLIAAGGGDVIITYATGEQDAKRVAKEIRDSGGRCQILPLTIGKNLILPANLPAVNQVYFFATPKIFGKRSNNFNDALYRDFFSIYVHGFEDLLMQLLDRGNRFSALYPSTVALENPLPELAEYVKAKAEGEALCQRLAQNNLIKILMPRLRRTATDQSQTLLQVPAADPFEIMAPLVSQMTELGRQSS